MQELITIQSTPAQLNANFEVVEKALAAELSKYDGVVVTRDTMPDAKKLAADLNKTASLIDDRRKEEVAKASEPIKQFDAQMKSLVEMCKKGRLQLTEQIKIFEDESREEVKQLLLAYRDEQWDALGVESEYQKATVDDMAILSNMTKTGNLTSRAENEVIARVESDRATQDRVTMRIAQLENASFKAGLDAPLTRDHVSSILFADEQVYESEVQRIISAELKRQEIARERAKAETEKEAMQKARAEAREEMRKEAERRIEESPQAEQESLNNQTTPPSKGMATVTATFEIEVSEHVSNDQIKTALQRQMTNAGFKSLQRIDVRRG